MAALLLFGIVFGDSPEIMTTSVGVRMGSAVHDNGPGSDGTLRFDG